MASKQGSAAQRAPKAQTGAAKSTPQTRTMKKPSASTGERDENYNLISVLYHALQGAETVAQYIDDVGDDDELRDFFEETREEYAARAAAAKELLGARLSELEEEGEDEEEGEEEEDED
jgi:hypothetical protein